MASPLLPAMKSVFHIEDFINGGRFDNFRIENFGGRYNDHRAAESNSIAFQEMVNAIGEAYVDGPWRQHRAIIRLDGGSNGGYLALSDTIPLPTAVIAGKRTIIPTIIDGCGCSVVVNADAPALRFSRKDYSASKINALNSDNARLVAENLFLASGSTDAGVVIEHAGKDFALRNIISRAPLGHGFRITNAYGGSLFNCYAYRCGNEDEIRDGFYLDNVNVLSMEGSCTARVCSGNGATIRNSSSLDGSLYLEANYGYGLDAFDMSNSNLMIYQEASRRMEAGRSSTGIKYRQGRLSECIGNTFHGRTGGRLGTGFDMDAISARANDFPERWMHRVTEGLEPVLTNSQMVTRNSFSGAYGSEEYEPKITHKGDHFLVTIPRGCFDHWEGTSGRNYWSPTDRSKLALGSFSDGDQAALTVDIEGDEAALFFCDQVGDRDIQPDSQPRLGWAILHDGTKGGGKSATLHLDSRKRRFVLIGGFRNAGEYLGANLAFNASHGTGPSEDLHLKIKLSLYKLER